MKQPKRLIVILLFTALAYFVTGRVSTLLALPSGFASPLWPPAGIALALVLVWGYRCWPGIWLGSILINLVEMSVYAQEFSAAKIIAIGVVGAGASLQACTGAFMVRRAIRAPLILEQPRDIVLLMVFGGLIACLINATIGNTVLMLAGIFASDGFAFRWLTWWVGDIVGVLCFAPIVLLLLSDEKLVTRARKTMVITSLLIVFLLVGYVYHSIRQSGERADAENFREKAEKIVQDVQGRLNKNLEVLTSLQSFLLASGPVNQQQFMQFTKHYFVPEPSVLAVSWLQRVPHRERSAFEWSKRAEGHRGYAISDRNTEGKLVVAAARPEYMPVTYDANGAFGQGMLVGLDPYGILSRREAMDIARDTNQPQVVAPVQLIHYPGVHGMLIYMPVYALRADTLALRRQHLRGHVAVVGLFTKMLQPLEEGLWAHDTHMTLSRVHPDAQEEIVYDSRTADRKSASGRISAPQVLHLKQAFSFAGKTFSVEVMEDNVFASTQRYWSLWLLLSGEALFTALVAAYILMITGRADAVQRMVREQTRALATSEYRLQSVLQNTADGLIAVSANGIIQLFNRASERIFGFHSSEVIGRSADVVFAVPGRQEKPWNKADIGLHELQGRRRDGSDFPMEIMVSEAPFDGEPSVFIAIIRDITERKQAEAMRQRLIDQLTTVNEELEQFAYVASHDLREPVRMVMNFTDILAADYADQLDAAGQEYMAICRNAAHKMEHMIADLLEYARLSQEGQRFTGVDCNLILDRVRENLAEVIETSGAKVEAKLLPMVNATPVRFVRLLENLIGNAIKYRAPNRKPHVKISAEDKGDHWLFAVTDNGIGIRNEYVQSIFMPFKRLHTEQEYPGTGIGLAICKRIVESFGGTIWARSVPGSGSMFYFTIPKRDGL